MLTMRASSAGLLVAFVAAGCGAVDPQPALDAVRRDVADRAAVDVDWEAERQGNETLDKCVTRLLQNEMSVDDAVAVSLLKSPQLRALYHELGVAQSDLVAAGLPENPVFSVERRFSGKAAEYDVTQEFMSLLLIPLRRRIAESEFESERLRLTHEILDHSAEVRAAYFRTQAAQQTQQMRRVAVSAMDAALAAARAIEKAGNTTALDAAQEERGAARARLELADAELEVALERERMNVLLGLWGAQTQWRIPPRLAEIPEDEVSSAELEKQAVTERFDLASLREKLAALAQSEGLTGVTGLLPELTVGTHTEREPEGTLTVGPSLSFPVPIFNWGQAARARADYLLLQAEDRYAALAIEIRSQVRTAFTRMSLARHKVEFYRREVMPVERAILEQSQLRYNGMFLGVFQLLEARQAEIDADREYIQALSEYWLARTDLEKAVGRRLPTGAAHHSDTGEPSAEPTAQHHHEE